jgi:NADP-dependent 3-hydroxy acid dehydrogenase YdfG
VKPDTRFFVTGAARGIGAATAALLVARGHRVLVCDVDGDEAAALATRLGPAAHAIALDVRDAASWERALDQAWSRWGGGDVLVNNAGLIHNGFVRDQSIEQIEHMVQVNFLGLVKGVRAGVPRLLAQGHGHVIDVGSLAAFVPLKGQTVYAATKHAVRAFHHGCALEWAEAPIAWTLVCPGAVDTGMLRQQVAHDSNALAFAGPALTPETVAAAILRAAETRPAEILLPAAQGAMLRVLGALPAAVRALSRRSERQGLRNLARQRGAPRS